MDLETASSCNEMISPVFNFCLRQRANQLFISSRPEQIHTVEMAQGFRHIAFLQTYRNNEDFIVGKEIGLFKSEFQFFVAVSLLFIKSTRKAHQHQVTLEDGIANFALPVLPGLEPFCIKSGIEPVINQALIKFINGFLVTVCVDEKDVCFLH